jgi:hypothetical protein
MGRSIDDVERGLSIAPTGIDTFEARQVLTQRMERICQMSTHGYIADPEKSRLIDLRLRIEAELGERGTKRVVDRMVDAEIERMRSLADEITPLPPPSPEYLGNPLTGMLDSRGIAADWGKMAAQHDRDEFENYLVELGRQQDIEHAEGCARLRWPGPDCPPRPPSATPATVGIYEQFVGPGYHAMVKTVTETAPGLMSLAFDFVPIVGQLKGIAEAIAGRDLITGRQLADWERGLNILLSVLPSAKGIFRTGKAGLTALAQAATKSGRNADEVYRVAKAASTLSEAEVRAAKQLLPNGKPANPTQFEKVAGTLDEMAGAGPKRARKGPQSTIASGVIEDNRLLSKSSAGAIEPPKKPPGKVIKPTKTSAAVSEKLIKNGITAKAIESMERVGFKVSDRVANVLISDVKVGAFVNNFHQCSGFERVLKEALGTGNKRKGARLVIDFVANPVNKIDPKLVNFELPAGITKVRTAKQTADKAARETDLVISTRSGGLNFEFKAYDRLSLTLWARDPKKIIQLVKDVKMLGRENIKWVFDSREVSAEFVYQKFKQAIKSDAVLAKEFGDGSKLHKAIDDLVVMYPPVPRPLPPKPPPPVSLHGATKPFADDDKKESEK